MNRCPRCGREVPAGAEECPDCGCTLTIKKTGWVRLPILIGSCALALAVVAGLLFNMNAAERGIAQPVPSSTPTEEPMEDYVPPTPAPTPMINIIRLYAFGRELDEDGFTAYVGDKPFTIYASIEPELTRAPVSWSVGDSASLVVSDDGLSCEFTAVKPSGKNELTVSCFGAKIVIPVFLWER